MLLSDLKNSTHHYDENNLNPFHLEGSIYNHTKMVYREYLKSGMYDPTLKRACLLHDCAKPECRELKHETKRARFFGHEGLSAYKALNYYFDIEMFKLIACHSFIHNKEFDKLAGLGSQKSIDRLKMLSIFDGSGRILKDELPDIEFKDFGLLERKVDNSKPVICVMIGPPCSGKSFYSADYSGNILSRDNIVMELSNNENYNEAFKKVNHDDVNKCLEQRRNSLLKGDDSFLVDMCNMSYKSRRVFTNKEVRKRFNVIACLMHSSLDEMLERNKQRENKTLDDKIIMDFCRRFCYPLIGVEFDNVY